MLLLLLLVAVTWILVILSCRKLLRVAEMFPEVARLPRFLQRVLGSIFDVTGYGRSVLHF